MAERQTHNLRVVGSSPTGRIMFSYEIHITLTLLSLLMGVVFAIGHDQVTGSCSKALEALSNGLANTFLLVFWLSLITLICRGAMCFVWP